MIDDQLWIEPEGPPLAEPMRLSLVLPDEGDVLWAPARAARDERAYWGTVIADPDVEAVAFAVLRRLRLETETLLAIDGEHRQALDRRLRESAHRQLSRLPLGDRIYDRARGHPYLLAQLAFEERGFPRPAAALYALTHDELYPLRFENQGRVLMALRFGVVRALYDAGVDDETRARCIAFAERTRRELETLERLAGEHDDLLHRQLSAWLETAGSPDRSA